MERVKNDMDEDIENYYVWIYMAKSTDGKGWEWYGWRYRELFVSIEI